MVVRFTPTSAATFVGNVNFTSNAGNVSGGVSGVGTAPPQLAVTPASQDFGNVGVGSSANRSFTVQNVGGGTLTGSATTTAPFSVFSGGSFTLNAGASQDVVVQFAPTATGSFTRNVSITSNGGNASPSVTGTAPVPPAAPSNLHANGVTATQVPLTWTDKATNETNYEVERATGAGSFALLITLGPNAISYTDTTVTPATKYSYRVRAINAGGNSAYSNTVTVTTPDVPPAAPSALSATAVSKSQINLQWTDGSNNETGFEIERSTNGTTFSRIKTVGVNVTTFANTGLTANKTYWYRVRAINHAGDSAYSNTDSATTPLQ